MIGIDFCCTCEFFVRKYRSLLNILAPCVMKVRFPVGLADEYSEYHHWLAYDTYPNGHFLVA